jgi:hypothetical protein
LETAQCQRIALLVVPRKLNDSAYWIAPVGGPGDEIIARLQHQFTHRTTLAT